MNESHTSAITKEPVSALHVEHLGVRFGPVVALDDVCLDVADGEYLGIIGPNGGGKTTFLRAVLGLIPSYSGSLSIYGETAGKSSGKSRTSIGYVPQSAAVDKQFPIMVRDVVLMGRLKSRITLLQRFSHEDRELADSMLEEVGIADLAERQISALSGGEFQRMLIARALAVQPRLLLLDEPTASVDANSRFQIYQLLNRLHERMTILLVTHDMLAISTHVRSLACLNSKLVYHGRPELSEDSVRDMYGCPVDLVAHGLPHRVLKTHG